MKDGKIHIPVRRMKPVSTQKVMKVTPEACNILVERYNESSVSVKELVSTVIVQSRSSIIFDKS